MPDPVHIYSLSGRLYYSPIGYQSDLNTPVPLYRPRRARPQLICIKKLPLGSGFSEDKQISEDSCIIKKLANSRDNAKRFLRSIISPSSYPFSRSSSVSSSVSSEDPNAHSSHNLSQSPGNSRTSLATVNEEGRMVGLERVRPTTRDNSTVGGPVSGMVHRPSLTESVRTASGRSSASNGSVGNVDRSTGDEKPVASGNGVSVSIGLTEPVLFLQGFEQSNNENRTTTMLRGYLHLRVTKSAKIKAISLNFRGKAETEWPEGKLYCHTHLNCYEKEF